MRLNKYIAKAGIASRRKADILISEGRIQVNGEVIINFSYQVKEQDIVTYNGKILSSEIELLRTTKSSLRKSDLILVKMSSLRLYHSLNLKVL